MDATIISMVAAYGLVIMVVGILKGRKEGDLDDYLAGGRRVPWWAVLGSLVATEVSAATYLAVPSVGFSENMGYLQMAIGSFLARIFVATVFIGVFYRTQCLSIYEYLGKRFGGTTQYTASVYFILTRILASGVRLMIAVTGFSVILGWSFGACLLLFGALTLAYTMYGGIKAVIWTDCIQALVFLSAGILGVSWLIGQLGIEAIMSHADAAGRLQLFQWQVSGSPWQWFNNPSWIVTAVLFGFVSSVAAFGTDQDMVQRLLASRSGRSAQRSLVLSGLIAFPVAGLFLFFGVCLFVWFQVYPDPDLPMKGDGTDLVVDSDRIMAFFITTAIPSWLKGLLLSGILAAAMSSLDSAMAAMSSSAVRDLLQPLMRKDISAYRWVGYGRWCTLLFAALLLSTAWFLRDGGTFLWLAFKITSLTYGSLLGVFLLGRLTKSGTDRGNLIAMISGSMLSGTALYLIETGRLPLAWTWLLLLGTFITFSVGYLLGGTGSQDKVAS